MFQAVDGVMTNVLERERLWMFRAFIANRTDQAILASFAIEKRQHEFGFIKGDMGLLRRLETAGRHVRHVEQLLVGAASKPLPT